MKLPYVIVVAPRVLSLLSSLTPIKIGAMTVWPGILTSRPMTQTTERHESIHLQQQAECFVIVALAWCVAAALVNPWLLVVLPFALPAGWPLYAPLYYGAYTYHYLRLGNDWQPVADRLQVELDLEAAPDSRGTVAYLCIPFEQEAYVHEEEVGYLDTRAPFAWLCSQTL